MPIDLAAARSAAIDVLRPHRFYSRGTVNVGVTDETIPWELFQGRLLPPSQTRQHVPFSTFTVRDQPHNFGYLPSLVSLKLDASGRMLHVVRCLDAYVHEAVSEGNVIHTQEVRRPVSELIASFALDRFDSPDELRHELACAIGRAIAGTRLPLTPVEAPMPAFSFGHLGYLYEAPRLGPLPFSIEHLSAWLMACPSEQLPRTLELWLRAAPDDRIERPGDMLTRFRKGDGIDSVLLLGTLRAIFDDVSLSPWTDFVPRVVRLLGRLEALLVVDAAAALDFESSLLRLVCRHLTAYDLVTFHHRGANYPDALLLDVVLNDYLLRLEKTPALFVGEAGRIRRRALRQAYVIRRQYEDHPVPDVPTSPGERQRVLPSPHPRVPEEQIVNPADRKRKLYAGDPLLIRLTPLALNTLRQSVADLSHPDERRELGAAVFLDRPFNGGKAPVEPDATPLLASLAYSAFVAARRLHCLRDDLKTDSDEVDLTMSGLTLDRIGAPARLGTVSLADAARAAPDFVFLRTLAGSVRPLLAWIDFGTLRERMAGRVLLARAPSGPTILAYDEALQPFAELTPRLEQGYVGRRGLEYPAAAVTTSPI